MALVIFCGSCNAFLFLVMRVICLWTPSVHSGVISTVKPLLVKDGIQFSRQNGDKFLSWATPIPSLHYNGIINFIVIILVLFIIPRS